MYLDPNHPLSKQALSLCMLHFVIRYNYMDINLLVLTANRCSFSVGVDPNATTSENKEEMDARSVFIGNVSFISSLYII